MTRAFGRILRDRRLKVGLSQEQLAFEAGVPPTSPSDDRIECSRDSSAFTASLPPLLRYASGLSILPRSFLPSNKGSKSSSPGLISFSNVLYGSFFLCSSKAASSS